MGENDSEYYEEQQASEPGFTSSRESLPREKANANDGMSRENAENAGTVKVEHGVVFNLPMCNLRGRKIIELQEHYLVLYQHFMIYKVRGKVEELDAKITEELGTEEWVLTKYNYRWTRMRADLRDVNMYYDNKEKLWAVELVFDTTGSQGWFYANGKDAKAIHDVLQNYFITRDQK